jgi:hypothetical protein
VVLAPLPCWNGFEFVAILKTLNPDMTFDTSGRVRHLMPLIGILRVAPEKALWHKRLHLALHTIYTPDAAWSCFVRGVSVETSDHRMNIVPAGASGGACWPSSSHTICGLPLPVSSSSLLRGWH